MGVPIDLNNKTTEIWGGWLTLSFVIGSTVALPTKTCMATLHMICKHWMCLLIFLGFDATCAMFSQCSPVSRQFQTNWCYWCSYPFIYIYERKVSHFCSHLMISSKNEHTQNSGSQKYADNEKGFSLEVFSNMSNKHTSPVPAPSSAYFFIYIHPFRTFRANKSHEAITPRWDLLTKANAVVQTLSKNKPKIKVS